MPDTTPTSPVLTGRSIILTDATSITKDNVVEVLSSALLLHETNRVEIDYLYNYNKGNQPILNREKKVRPEINNKVVANRANEITSFKVGYLLGEPLQYVSRSASRNVTDTINELNECMYAEDKGSKDKDLAEWFTICGTAFRMVLPSKDPGDESPFKIYTLDPRYCFVVYNNGLGGKPVMGVKYIQRVSDGVCVFSVYTETEYFEIESGVITKHEKHTLHAIPIIEYPANNARLGAFEVVIPLLDAYNLAQSDRINGLEQFIQALIKFVNVDINTEDFEKLKDMGGIKFKSDSQNPADVAYITPEVNQQNTKIILDDLYQTILTIVGMPNRNGGTSTSDTGSAVIMRDGWEVAEAKAKDTEQTFKKSEKQFLRLVLHIGSVFKHWDLKVSEVDLRFTRRNYENIANKATVLTQMLGCEKVHPKLAFAHSGMFADAELAYKMSMEYYAEQQKKAAAAAPTPGGNNPKGDDDDGSDTEPKE